MALTPADILGDPARLAALDATRLAGTPAEEAFDRLTRLAARVADAPVAMLSFIDADRQWIKSIAGSVPALAARREIPLAHSVCKHVITGCEPLLVSDLEARPEVDGGLAARILGVRAYAGVPLVSRDGHSVGVLCVGNPQAREWDPAVVAALQDVAALAADEMELRRRSIRPAAERMFIALVEQSLAGIYVIQDDHFRYVNPCFARMLNHPPEHFREPVPVAEFVLDEDRALVAENIRRRVSGEVESIRYPVRARRGDGSIIHLEVHGSRMELDGRPALIGVAVDVTDRVRAERERLSAMMARDRFYAMLSHELRTPVSAVMLYNDLLLGGGADPLSLDQRDAVERSQRSAEHLLELINDLLDLSKLEAGKLETRVEDVEVVELAESVVAALGALADEHGCALSLDVAERPMCVTGDARRVRQILL
ncbi:MAG TPA: histidine kinase dimerization/phospho-acceptor domain-containing protein, partial [Longimicrobium sp.]|nr:histidine kinase dimerization/phospho-acceptor domain-containing protein [Longimicrobium sp.]